MKKRLKGLVAFVVGCVAILSFIYMFVAASNSNWGGAAGAVLALIICVAVSKELDLLGEEKHGLF